LVASVVILWCFCVAALKRRSIASLISEGVVISESPRVALAEAASIMEGRSTAANKRTGTITEAFERAALGKRKAAAVVEEGHTSKQCADVLHVLSRDECMFLLYGFHTIFLNYMLMDWHDIC
jgi:hypothetical protein